MALEKKKTYLIALAMIQLVFVVLAVMYLAGFIFNIDEGLWAFMNAVLLNLLFVGLAYDRTYKYVAFLYGFVALMAFGAFVSTCVILSVPNTKGLGFEQKAFFALVVAVESAALVYINLKSQRALTSEAKDIAAKDIAQEAGAEPVGASSCAPSFGCCCFNCCSIFAFVIIILASVHSILQGSEVVDFFPGNDALVDVDGHLMYARCEGEGSPPVVFFHGLSGNSLDFFNIQPTVAETTRTCSIDRAGIGQSRERGPLPRTSEQHAKETEAVLEAIGITGDFIAVGHSYGGFNMRTYNQDFPGRMQGIVFVDTVTTDSNICDPELELSFGPIFEYGQFMIDAGLVRVVDLFNLAGALGYPLEFLDEGRREYLSNIQSYWARTTLDEYKVWGESCFNLKNSTEVLPFPITVIAAEKGIFEGDLTKIRAQADLSENSTFIEIKDVGHTEIIWAQASADVIAAETLKLIDTYKANN